MATKTPTEESTPNGRLLTNFLQKEWDALGTTRGAWCRVHGIPDSTVHRWGSAGVEPDMRNMALVAEALRRPLLEILLAAGYVDPTDVVKVARSYEGTSMAKVKAIRGIAERPPAPTLADALRPADNGGDPTISDAKREAMLQVSEAFDLVESGQRSSVRRRVPGRARG